MHPAGNLKRHYNPIDPCIARDQEYHHEYKEQPCANPVDLNQYAAVIQRFTFIGLRIMRIKKWLLNKRARRGSCTASFLYFSS